jgi:hypothetical protein
MDHLEQAGLNPVNDWPPSSYDDLVEIGMAVKNEGVTDTPLPMYTANDTFDEQLPQWAMAEGGEDGLLLNSDWSDTIIDNDVWKTSFERYVDIQIEHDLSWGNAVGSGDEAVVPLIIAGQATAVQANFLTYPTLLEKAPDAMEDGTIRYGEPWMDPAGVSGAFLPYNHILNYRDDMDSRKARRKLKAGAKLIDLWLSQDNQEIIPQNYGQFPANQNAWETVRNEMDENYGHEAYVSQIGEVAENSLPWAVHPQAPTYQYSAPVPAAEQAMSGDLDPREAMDQGAQAIREQVTFEIDFSNVREPGDEI